MMHSHPGKPVAAVAAPGFNLRHLRAFVTVAELASVTRAAESLYRAQSAVTRSIHALETVIGEPLFERKAAGMLLNVYGKALLFRARRAIKEFELARDEIACELQTEARSMNAPLYSMLFNERRLSTFIKLAQSHHMQTVANALGITQPAVSACIADLEVKLGTPLFRRTAKGMLLTSAGDLLFFRARRAVAELRHAEADIAALRGAAQGRVIIGALPLGRTSILPRAIARVIASHPRLRISTVEGPFDSLVASLRAGEIDFIFGALRAPQYAKDLVGEPLIGDRIAVVARRGHPLARRRLAIEHMLAAQWILSPKGTPTRELFDLSFRDTSHEPPVEVIETSDLAILRGLLLCSDMITAISTRQLEHEIQSGELEVLAFDLPQTARMIGLLQRGDSHPTPGGVVLMDAIREVVAEIQCPAPEPGVGVARTRAKVKSIAVVEP